MFFVLFLLGCPCNHFLYIKALNALPVILWIIEVRFRGLSVVLWISLKLISNRSKTKVP